MSTFIGKMVFANFNFKTTLTLNTNFDETTKLCKALRMPIFGEDMANFVKTFE